MKKITVSIITIGDELLIGQTVDTNSAWMAVQLNRSGIWVHRRVAVGDNRESILQTLEEESRRSDVLLMTGGLGPTKDDMTKNVLCEYFGTHLVEDKEVLAQVTARLSPLNIPMLERNRQQALVPAACTVLPNEWGTAPGLWFEKDGRIYAAMPGVPHEMEGLMTRYVIPRLHERFNLSPVNHRTAVTMGMGESQVAERLAGFETGLPPFISLAYLPGNGFLRLRLTAAENGRRNVVQLEQSFKQLLGLIPDIVVDQVDHLPEQTVGELLRRYGLTLSTAESCTGGNIAHKITCIPGSSDYFKGTVVSYSNEIKQHVLGVPEAILKTPGAVSEATVKAMVTGVNVLLKTDVAVAVSGIMGPDGGTAEKPVGTVWMAAVLKDKIITRKYRLKYTRIRNIEIATNYALNMVREIILNQIPGD